MKSALRGIASQRLSNISEEARRAIIEYVERHGYPLPRPGAVPMHDAPLARRSKKKGRA